MFFSYIHLQQLHQISNLSYKMPIKKKKKEEEKELSGENETWTLSRMLLVGQPACASTGI